MTKTILVLVASALVLTSCGTVRDSRLNPFNWFGGSRAVAPVSETATNPLIPRQRESILRDDAPVVYAGTRVAQISELSVDRRPGGAIVRVKGVTAAQGAFDVRLVEDEDSEDRTTLDFVLVALQPSGAVGPVDTREVTAATFVTNQTLQGVRQIRVSGASNARAVRR